MKLAGGSACTLGSICQNCSILHHFRHNTVCILHKNSRWPPKIAGKYFLGKSRIRYPGCQKLPQNRSISHSFQDIKDSSFFIVKKNGGIQLIINKLAILFQITSKINDFQASKKTYFRNIL